MAKAFSLTDEQQQKLKELQKEAQKELANLLQSKDSAGRNEIGAVNMNCRVRALPESREQASALEALGTSEAHLSSPKSPTTASRFLGRWAQAR